MLNTYNIGDTAQIIIQVVDGSLAYPQPVTVDEATITIIRPDGSVVVNNGAMVNVGVGVYQYAYTFASNDIQSTTVPWMAIFSATGPNNTVTTQPKPLFWLNSSGGVQ